MSTRCFILAGIILVLLGCSLLAACAKPPVKTSQAKVKTPAKLALVLPADWPIPGFTLPPYQPGGPGEAWHGVL